MEKSIIILEKNVVIDLESVKKAQLCVEQLIAAFKKVETAVVSLKEPLLELGSLLKDLEDLEKANENIDKA